MLFVQKHLRESGSSTEKAPERLKHDLEEAMANDSEENIYEWWKSAMEKH